MRSDPRPGQPAIGSPRRVLGDSAAWSELTERTRARLLQMDRDANPDGTGDALDRYLSVFSDNIVVHGLVESGDTGKPGMRDHYAPVFSGFKDLKLVTEELVVAGNMAAQKYHAAGYVRQPDDTAGRRVAIRGYTFFCFGDDGLVAERWSNHDHRYRLTQWEGPQAAAKGRRLQHYLNGPSLTEPEVFERLEMLEAALNLISCPEDRSEAVRSCFAPEVEAFGVDVRTSGLDGLMAHFEGLWSAVPDLVFHNDAVLTAWGLGAARWRATGYWTAPLFGVEPSDDAATLFGETIVRYNHDGLIDGIWLNEDLAGFIAQCQARRTNQRS